MKPKTVKVEGWINIYFNGQSSNIYESKEIAEGCSMKHEPQKTIFISEEIEVE